MVGTSEGELLGFAEGTEDGFALIVGINDGAVEGFSVGSMLGIGEELCKAQT